MRVPKQSVPVVRRSKARAVESGVSAQGGWWCCTSKCHPRRGFLACFARCKATGEVCDGGLHNCERKC